MDRNGHDGASVMTEETLPWGSEESSSGDSSLGEQSPTLRDEDKDANDLYREEGSGASVRYEDLLPAQ